MIKKIKNYIGRWLLEDPLIKLEGEYTKCMKRAWLLQQRGLKGDVRAEYRRAANIKKKIDKLRREREEQNYLPL